MLDSDTTERIRAIFLHDGRPVTIFDFVILLGWEVVTFDAAIKWRVVTLEDSADDVPRVSHAQLILHAREQWAEAEIVEALGEDARLFDPLAPFTPPPQIPALSYVRDLAPFAVRHSSAAPAAAAAVSSDPFAPRRAAVDFDPNRGVYKVSVDEMFGPRPPHVPCTLPTPAQRRRELRDMRREAALAEAPLPPPRRRRTDGIREATFTATVTEYDKVVPLPSPARAVARATRVQTENAHLHRRGTGAACHHRRQMSLTRSMPLRCPRLRSRTRTSTGRDRNRVRTSSADAASPAKLSPSASSMIWRKPLRTTGWSSAMAIRVMDQANQYALTSLIHAGSLDRAPPRDMCASIGEQSHESPVR
jgi:hypothetical protein